MATLNELAEENSGMVIISGPTGSGKSTTLERLMRQIVATNPGGNCLSVEDPPEYRIPGLVQLPVANLKSDEDRGHAYAEAIAAALRSDPDRIMIGEIRTRATACHAFEAVMTGHQVLTTVHANDSLGIVPRLMDIGVEKYKLRDPSLIRGLLAQRLVRRLCRSCRRPVHPARANLRKDLVARLTALLPEQPIWMPGPGCGNCRDGYQGRTVIAELATPDHILLDLMVGGEREPAMRHWVRNLGGRPFVQHALEKIASGIVDPVQVESKVCRLVAP